MEIQVLFFGVLTEVTKTGFRHYRDIRSFDDLRHRIIDDFPEIVHYNFRISVNNEIVKKDTVLKDGDEIACLPPFAGG